MDDGDSYVSQENSHVSEENSHASEENSYASEENSYASEGDNSCLFLDVFRRDLGRYLSNTSRAGTFAHASCLDGFPNPALDVKGAGVVGLPLSDRDSQALKDASHRAPFGKGKETVVDEPIRKTWEINKTNISIRNTKWDSWVQKPVLPIMTEHLGVDLRARKHTRAELYKLLPYEEGAHFAPHQDSEKAPGMFGTLVICLPTEHQGGGVVLQHGGDKQTYDSSRTSISDHSFAAWYSDVTHEVKPVASGHRLVLTYNLINSQPKLGLPSAADVQASDAELQNIIERWKKQSLSTKDGEHIEHLSWIINYNYSEANRSYQNLKGHDKQVTTQLARVGAKVGFTVCLATLERMQSGAVDEGGEFYGGSSHEIMDETDSSWELGRIIDLHGETLAKDLSITEDHVVQKEPFDSGEPDEEDFQGYTGNEGAETTHWHRRSVVFIIPSENILKALLDNALLKGGHGIESIGKRLLSKFTKDRDTATFRAELQQFTRTMVNALRNKKKDKLSTWSMTETDKFTDEAINCLAACAASLADVELFSELTLHVRRSLPLDSFFSIGRNLPSSSFDTFHSLLCQLVRRVGSLQSTLAALVKMRNGFEEQILEAPEATNSMLKAYDGWSLAVVTGVLEQKDLVTPDDAKALFTFAANFRHRLSIECVLPFVRKHASNTAFTIEFLAAMHSNMALFEAPDNSEVLQQTFMHLSDAALRRFVVGKLEFEDDWEASIKRTHGWRIGHVKQTTIDALRIEQQQDHHVDATAAIKVWQGLVKRDRPDMADALAWKLVTCSRNWAIKDEEAKKLFVDLTLPFLRQLFATMKADECPLDSPFVQRMARETSEAYLKRCVGRRPQPQTDWALRSTGCRCGNCIEVNKFLVSQRQTFNFSASKKLRQHVHQLLEILPVTHVTSYGSDTMTITKHGNHIEERLKQWRKRRDQAVKNLRTFDESDFELLTGGSIDSLVAATLNKSSKASAGAGTSRPPLQRVQQPNIPVAQPGPYGAFGSTVPAKRKADVSDVVDLTGSQGVQ